MGKSYYKNPTIEFNIMIEKYCTNCKAEFMMAESFNLCGFCKTNTLVNKSKVKDITTKSDEINVKEHSRKTGLPFLTKKDSNKNLGDSQGCIWLFILIPVFYAIALIS